MEQEIKRIREFEVSSVRIEESEKHRMMMEKYREEIEKNYQDKLNKLKDREMDIIDKCKERMRVAYLLKRVKNILN